MGGHSHQETLNISAGNLFAWCTLCCCDFNISHGGRNDVTTHVNGKKHRELAAAASSTQSVTSFFRPAVEKSVIEAETRWSLYQLLTNCKKAIYTQSPHHQINII